MNVDEIIAKVKELIGEGKIDAATKFVEEHKDDLGDQFESVKGLLSKADTGSIVDKIKELFK
ncbi:hypothetical protein [Enterococcus wangshanyuanii]|uniref:Isoleucyl-tRNA synthetase n=1 Tax=Enterococcus wangshanyuanii TaxID=2005703 RepID=A0ABQ1PTE8_9ENTE|nr:hypothetical protein [Enterococcus wangshanyuanii]GGD03071.1 hypothetical protein GCM10011573_35710 [Enterococcus wangshanyuanii]